MKPPNFQRKWSQLVLQDHPIYHKPIGLGIIHNLRTFAVDAHWKIQYAALGQFENLRDWKSRKAGKVFSCSDGHLGTLSEDFNPPPLGTPLELTPPFAVYGIIFRFWRDAGSSTSKYGRPLCDEQALPDGGRCGIFEGGHIHIINGKAVE